MDAGKSVFEIYTYSCPPFGKLMWGVEVVI